MDPEILRAAQRGDYRTVLRLARIQRGWTQDDLGKCVGLVRTSISRMETGKQPLANVGLLRELARALDMPPHLFGLAPIPPTLVANHHENEGDDDVRRRDFLATAGVTALTFGDLVTTPAMAAPLSPAAALSSRLERTLLSPGAGPVAGPAALPGVLRAARIDYRATNYSSLAGRLSTLVTSSEAFVADTPRPDSFGVLARSYNAMTNVLFKLPVSHLEWLSTDRAARAARHAEDPILLAECERQMATALRRAGRSQEAVDLCVSAVERLMVSRPDADPSLVMCTAAYSAAVAGDRERAHELLAEARRASLNTQEADCWTAIGTVNIDVYAVDIGTVLHDHGSALRAISAVPVNALPSTERKARFLVDAAEARAAAQQPVLAARTLALAGRVAPQETKTRRAASRLAASLRQARPDTDATLRAVGL